MKKSFIFLPVIALMAIGLTYAIVSCKKKEVTTDMTINLTETAKLNIGDTAKAKITIVASGVNSFKYYKVVDNVNGTATDVKANLTQSGDTYTYNFKYKLQKFDDLKTLGFEFELTDDKSQVKTVALAVNTNISIQTMFVKYDWKVTASTDPVWGDVLTAADGAAIYRFTVDGTYDEDLTATYATPQYYADTHHFCDWVYKTTPSNGDTIAIVRMIRRTTSGNTAVDEYYDYRIISANESQMKMYWEIPSWGLKITNTFQSQAKGAFQPYGTAAMAATVNANAALSCSNISNALLTFK